MSDARHLPTVALCGFPDGVAGAARAQLVDRVAIASFAGPELLERIGGYSPSCVAWVLHAREDRVDLGPMMRTTVPVALVAPVDRPVLGAYLRLVEAKTARLFPYQRQSWEVLPELCSWLDGLLAGLTSADLVRLLLDADPALQRCEPIVRCLLAAPHSVRRPADVARAVGMSDLRVRAQAREAGFSRVDHLLTHLRLRAGQLLRERTDWPRHRIDQVLGIRDRSNFRRQAARVSRTAPVR